MHRSLSAGLPSLVLTGALALAGVTGAQAQAQQPSVSVSGVSYAQYSYQLKDTANHLNEFDVTRAYVNVIGKFAGGVGTRVTADIYSNGNSLAYRLKYAYLTYTPEGSALTGKFGLIHTPWVDWEEGLWGYRMQGSIALDRNHYLTSADLGVGVDGKWNQDQVNMQVTFVNGEGYSGGSGDQRKDIEGRVSVRLMNTDDMGSRGGLRLTGYAGYGKPSTGGERQRFVGMASYKSKTVTLAGEFAATKDSTTGDSTQTPAIPAVAEKSGRVISAFGVFHLPNSKVALIGRVDVVDPNTDVSGDRQTRIIGGISYQLSPNLRVLVDVDHLSYQTDAPNAADLKRSQALFQTQFTF